MDKKKNFETYGSEQVREYDLKKIKGVPIAMFTGKYDRVVSVEKNSKYADIIPGVFSFEVLEADHLSFLIGKDMSYMEKVISMLLEKNPHNFSWEDKFAHFDQEAFSAFRK